MTPGLQHPPTVVQVGSSFPAAKSRAPPTLVCRLLALATSRGPSHVHAAGLLNAHAVPLLIPPKAGALPLTC